MKKLISYSFSLITVWPFFLCLLIEDVLKIAVKPFKAFSNILNDANGDLIRWSGRK